MVKEYFKNETEKTKIFKNAWKSAESCANRNLKSINKGDEALTKDHMQAICVYMSDDQKFYDIFNASVRTDSAIYGKSFPFHSIYFWLASAVQILSNNKKCHITYRRTKTPFTGKVNQIIWLEGMTRHLFKVLLCFHMLAYCTCTFIRTFVVCGIHMHCHLWQDKRQV